MGRWGGSSREIGKGGEGKGGKEREARVPLLLFLEINHYTSIVC